MMKRRFFLKTIGVFSSASLFNQKLLLAESLALNKKKKQKNILIVAGTRSGVGKNTIASGLIRFLSNKNFSTIPFKPVAIDTISRSCPIPDYTPSIIIQSIAAKQQPNSMMNPVWYIYDSINVEQKKLFINGTLEEKMLPIENIPSAISDIVLSNLDTLLKKHSSVIIEGTGSLDESMDCQWMKDIIKYYNPKFILVSDCYYGGGLASVVGSLEIIPEKIRKRIMGIVFNKINIQPDEPPMNHWCQLLKNKYDIQHVASFPILKNLENLSEDHLPINEEHLIDLDLDWLAGEISSYFSSGFLSEIIESYSYI